MRSPAGSGIGWCALWGRAVVYTAMIPGTHIPGTEATARQTTKEPPVVAYFISVIIVS